MTGQEHKQHEEQEDEQAERGETMRDLDVPDEHSEDVRGGENPTESITLKQK